MSNDKITIRDNRLRAVDESAVTALCNDIEANGLNQPIIVRTLKNGRFELIDGGHKWCYLNRERASKAAFLGFSPMRRTAWGHQSWPKGT